MGHVRLGKLPATRKWREVVALLDEQDIRIAAVAAAVERACDKSLAQAVNDPAFVEALWLLLKIPTALKEVDYPSALTELGLKIPQNPTLTDILAGFVDAIESCRRDCGKKTTDLSLIARNAAISGLQSLAQERSPSLWRPTTEDERTTIATFASTEHFGELAQRFFTNLLQGHIQYFLDREIPRHIGTGGMIRSVADTSYFESAVHRHCQETTLIIRAFAKDWLGKNRFHLGKDIKRQDAADLAAFAFTKVRRELSNRSGATL